MSLSTDPLRTMRDEMAYRVEIWNRPNMEMVERWLATLDAYLALPRCPECGTTMEPAHRFTQPPEPDALIRVYLHDYGHEVTCSNPACAFAVIGMEESTKEETLAAFYKANP